MVVTLLPHIPFVESARTV